MKYPNEFKTLIDATSEDYIGHGNPNAKILILGQEPAIDRETEDGKNQYAREIAHNAVQWRNVVSKGVSYDSVDQLDFGFPLHPYSHQKFQVRSITQNGGIKAMEGTSKTWHNYQKLINRIFEMIDRERKPMTRDDLLDFHRLSFHTDMSDVTFKKHEDSGDGGRESVKKRELLLSNDFFKGFPIVIAAVGHFPKETFGKEGDKYFNKVFGVEYLGNEGFEGHAWLNVSIRMDEGRPLLLLHTPQFSYSSVSDKYIGLMASRIVEFARTHDINLYPE